MASPTPHDIKLAMRAKLLDISHSDMPAADQRHWMNLAFTPTVGTAYIRENFVVSSDRLTATAQKTMMGFVQWTIFWPSDQPLDSAESLAEAIVDAFKPGVVLSASVAVYRTERGGEGPDGDKWYRLPVTVYWRAHRNI